MELLPIEYKRHSRFDKSDLQDWTGNDYTRAYFAGRKKKPERDSGVISLLLVLMIFVMAIWILFH